MIIEGEPMLTPGEVSQPAHMIFINESGDNDTIVLSIRGTQSLGDCLSDCMCDLVPLNDAVEKLKETAFKGQEEPVEVETPEALCHQGMLDAAVWLLERHGVRLKAHHEAGKKIFVTGHSMGAGTAALVAVLLQAFKIPAQGVA